MQVKLLSTYLKLDVVCKQINCLDLLVLALLQTADQTVVIGVTFCYHDDDVSLVNHNALTLLSDL